MDIRATHHSKHVIMSGECPSGQRLYLGVRDVVHVDPEQRASRSQEQSGAGKMMKVQQLVQVVRLAGEDLVT